MAVVKKGHTITMGAATDTLPGWTSVNKLSAKIPSGGGAGSTITLREGGASGEIFFHATGANAFVANTTPSLATYSKTQKIRDLYVEAIANATLVVSIA